MIAFRDAPARRAIGIGAAAFCLALGGLMAVVSAMAQEPSDQAPASPPTAPAQARGDRAHEASAWDLPRLFYEPRQRRGLDAQERALHLGLNGGSDAPSGPRFDGWVSGPGGTHAWVSGTPYRADRSGHLRAAEEHSVDPASDEMENAQAHFDKARGVLVMQRETEGTLRLRVGEVESTPEAAPPVAASDRR
jgi:hypothetical protein